jgi:hypothetical protein
MSKMSKKISEACERQSKYWKTKPVTPINEKVHKSGQILSHDELKKYGKDSEVKLPEDYTWKKINLSDEINPTEKNNLETIADFLTEHYKRGTESEYIIRYDSDRLRWEMCNNGYFMAVLDKAGEIVGVIGYTNRNVQIFDDQIFMTEPTYMCCKKSYRGTGIAKVLMDEVIRQSVVSNIDCGIFCNNRLVAKPIATFRQYSRPINYKKLREQDFVEIQGVDDDVAHNKTKINLAPNKKYVVAEKTDENIKIVHKLYNEFMETFNVHIVMSPKEIENYMFNTKYVKTLLVMNDSNVPVDFVTYNFYDLINTSINTNDKINNNDNNNNNNIIKVANFLMYSANETRSDLLFINTLKQIAYDKNHVLYINDMMHNNEIILSNVKSSDVDTDDEEENAIFDHMIVKTGKKTFLNMFNWKTEPFKQNTVSWLLF